MAVPTVATYSATALVDAQTAFLDLIDAGAGAGKVKIRDSADVLLCTVTLTDPAGTVSGAGVLTITQASDGAGTVVGTAAYGEITDSDDTIHLSLPAETGTVAVSGKLVLNSLAILIDSPVTIVSATIG